jgi:hypothetical protein
LWSPGLSYYLPHTHPNFFPLLLSILLQFLASSRSKFSITKKNYCSRNSSYLQK